ncbi:MAG: hypothetical protein JXR61_14175 [Prolixibacteraceae bacterium]|nr:hypothetical protein [Prolixibacteraceae bacterium]
MNEWRRIKDKLRYKYPELTDADMIWGRTTRNDLLQNISTKLGKSKKELMDEIESFDSTSGR